MAAAERLEANETRDVRTSVQDGVLLVQFSRPERRNPLSSVVLKKLDEIVENIEPDIERVIFTGESDVFASGADLNEIDSLTEENAAAFARRGQALMSRIERLEALTIAAINGFCFGGALDLALACARRVASPHASFAHPGAGLGIITGWGGTQRLPRLIGTANALEMFFTASPIDANRAAAIGLADQIADDPARAARSI